MSSKSCLKRQKHKCSSEQQVTNHKHGRPGLSYIYIYIYVCVCIYLFMQSRLKVYAPIDMNIYIYIYVMYKDYKQQNKELSKSENQQYYALAPCMEQMLEPMWKHQCTMRKHLEVVRSTYVYMQKSVSGKDLGISLLIRTTMAGLKD